jgi:hypothetical protein
MTEDDAMRGVGHLAGGLNGFTATAVDEYVAQLEKLDDADALDEVCQEIVRTWTDRWKPSVADVIAAYHAHPRVRAEREERIAAVMLSEDGGRVVPHSEGLAIANDAYRSLYSRNMGEAPTATPAVAEALIENGGRQDRYGNWVAHYTDVLRGMRGDQARTQASLHALGRRLLWDGRGNLTLRPPDIPTTLAGERNPPPAPEDAAPPPDPSERPPDPSGLLSKAIGITRSRMEDQ